MLRSVTGGMTEVEADSMGGAPIRRLAVLAAVLVVSCTASAARAGKLADVFSSGELSGLELAPVGPALASTVAATYPVASASSSVTYVFDPKTETFERQTRVLGPIIGERAETIGQGQITLGLSYSHVDVSTINGDDLGDLVNLPSIRGQVVSFAVPGGLHLADTRFSSYLPVHVRVNIDVEADIATPGVTYGLTRDLDVNLTVPIIRTLVGVKTLEQVPDPRLPQFALPPGDPNAQTRHRSAFARATGFGDVLLRGKYVLLRERPVDLAAGLGVSFPSGDRDDFHGTGDYRVQPQLIVSRVIGERFEPLLNLGVDVNADAVDRSVLRWAVGATAKIAGPLTGAVVFLGRNEFAAPSDKISAPFFFQIERNDIYDASLGLRLLFAEGGVISANAIVPVNDDGLRADVIPTFEVQYSFSGPAW
jgi:hypothetical protein